VGTGGRAERIRTYNFPQSRITDHRAGWSTKNLEGVLEGGEALDDLIGEVWEAKRKEMIEGILNDA
jgi:peptide chain release factor 1